MIQAPQVQYIPQQVPVQQYNPVVSENTVATPYQVANPIYNYPTTSCYCQGQTAGKSQYNGVNIEIINPQGQGGAANAMPATFVPNSTIIPIQPYVMPTMYPPQVPSQPVNQVPVMQEPVVVPATPVVVEPATTTEQPASQTPVVPAPQVVTEQPTTVEPVVTPVIQEPVTTVDANLSPETFAGRLATDDVDAQRATLEELGEIIKNNDALAPALLDSQVVDALTAIINKDNSALAGPTPEVLELRKKPENELTPEQQTQAYSVSPLEAAELNKQYALYTIAFMQDRLNNEVTKRNEPVIQFQELPIIETVIETAKSNPNDEVRVSAISALSCIARPEYKNDLATIFELAKADQSATVQKAATEALEALNKMEAAPAPAPAPQA